MCSSIHNFSIHDFDSILIYLFFTHILPTCTSTATIYQEAANLNWEWRILLGRVCKASVSCTDQFLILHGKKQMTDKEEYTDKWLKSKFVTVNFLRQEREPLDVMPWDARSCFWHLNRAQQATLLSLKRGDFPEICRKVKKNMFEVHEVHLLFIFRVLFLIHWE